MVNFWAYIKSYTSDFFNHLSLIYYYYYFYFTILYRFCHTSTWIQHRYTRVPHPEPPSHLPPHYKAVSYQYFCLILWWHSKFMTNFFMLTMGHEHHQLTPFLYVIEGTGWFWSCVEEQWNHHFGWKKSLIKYKSSWIEVPEMPSDCDILVNMILRWKFKNLVLFGLIVFSK